MDISNIQQSDLDTSDIRHVVDDSGGAQEDVQYPIKNTGRQNIFIIDQCSTNSAAFCAF